MEINISVKDCVTILRNAGYKNFQLIDYKLVPLDTKQGFLGEYFKLKIRFDEKVKQFFVKALATAASQRRFVLDNGVVSKEEAFYSKFVPKCLENGVEILQKCAAKCYLIKKLDLMIFDDLSLDDYQILDARNCLSLQHVYMTLKTFAKFHASTYILEEKLSKKNGKIYRLPHDFNVELQEAIFQGTKVSNEYLNSVRIGVRAHIKLFKNNLQNISEGALVNEISSILDDYPMYVKPSLKYRNVLCHGDVWSTNIMYKHINNVPVDVKLVDFQLYRYCPPTMDVITFLYFCTDRKFRRENFETCIHFYYDELDLILRSHHLDLETIFPRKDFVESIEYYKRYAVSQASTYGHLTMIDRDLLSDILSDPDSVEEIMLKDRGIVMKKMFEKDPIYKWKLQEHLDDLLEIILESKVINANGNC